MPAIIAPAASRSEVETKAQGDGARRLDRSDGAERGASGYVLLDLVRLIEEVEHLRDRGHARAAAEREPLLDPRVEGEGVREAGPAARDGLDRFRPLVEVGGDDAPGEGLAVLQAGWAPIGVSAPFPS